jgi:hypothetical protein
MLSNAGLIDFFILIACIIDVFNKLFYIDEVLMCEM